MSWCDTKRWINFSFRIKDVKGLILHFYTPISIIHLFSLSISLFLSHTLALLLLFLFFPLFLFQYSLSHSFSITLIFIFFIYFHYRKLIIFWSFQVFIYFGKCMSTLSREIPLLSLKDSSEQGTPSYSYQIERKGSLKRKNVTERPQGRAINIYTKFTGACPSFRM